MEELKQNNIFPKKSKNSENEMEIDEKATKNDYSKVTEMEVKNINEEKFKISLDYTLEDCINILKKRISIKNSLEYQILNRRKAKLDKMINSNDSYFSENEIKARDVNSSLLKGMKPILYEIYLGNKWKKIDNQSKNHHDNKSDLDKST